MAYLDFEFGPGTGVASAPTPTAGLDPLERQIVLLSRGDGVRSVQARCRWDWILDLIYGFNPARSLADQKLEALRRYAVLRRLHGDQIAPEELDHVRAAGFAPSKLASLHRMVDPWRAPRHRHQMLQQSLMILAICLFGALLYPWISDSVGDELIAVLLLGVAFVTSLPLLLAGDVRP